MIRRLPLKLVFIVLVFFTSLSKISAQASLWEISLKEQIDNSSLVIEGQVVSQRSFWGTKNKLIFTAYTVNVYKIFKGEYVETIEVLALGGIIGMDALVVSHGLKLGIGSVGLLTLYDSNFNISDKNKTKNKQFKAYSGVQGFYAYNLEENVAVNSFSKRKGIKSLLYKEVLEITKERYRTVASFDIESGQKKSSQKNSSLPPTGITFSPTTIAAGTGSVLTIEGSGFGTTQGKVGFRNADKDGSPFFNALDSQVLSWADDMITVEVPVIGSNDDSIDGTAGTGTIRVTNSTGSSDTSSAVLTISYAEINVSGDFTDDNIDNIISYQTQHQDDNGSGGYTWVMEEGFFKELMHTGAPDAFLRAFNSWRCETKVNWEVSNTFTTTTLINTTENIITFDENGTDSELPTGTLGKCYFGFSGNSCTSGIVWAVTSLDIVFNDNVDVASTTGVEETWYFGTGTISSSQFDFETVALHELGHGHQLGHVINSSNVMHYVLGANSTNTVLDSNSIAGANDVQSRSILSQVCSPAITPMTDYAGSCGLSIEDNNLENNIFLYPNPTKHEFFIKSTVVNLDKVEIYDVSGRLISQIDVTDNNRIIPVNLTGASKGLYFVNMYYSNANFITKKLILK